MMITLAVFALLLMVGLPSMTTWMQNQQIRTAAEGIQAGLQRQLDDGHVCFRIHQFERNEYTVIESASRIDAGGNAGVVCSS